VATSAIRRVLIGLGSAETPSAVLDLATELAVAFHAEIAGLFVEEDMLYAVSDLPAAQALTRAGGAAELDRRRLTAEIAARARFWRRALSARAELSHMSWSFESRRGEALTVLRGSARADDVLLLTGTTATFTLRARIALAIQAMGAARAVLVVPERLKPARGAIVVLTDGERDGAHIDLAANIARAMREPLLILARSDTADSETRPMRGQVISLSEDGPDAMAMLLRRLQPRLVIAPSDGELFADVGIAASLMQAAGAPFLLLRPGA